MVRFKNRYMTIEVIPSNRPTDPLSLKSGAFNEAILRTVQQIHGDFGTAAIRMGYVSKYINEQTRIAIIRVRHGPHNILASCIPFITKIGKEIVRLQILHIGATMKHSFKFIRSYQRQYLDKMFMKLKTTEEKQNLEMAVMDFTKTDVQQNLEKLN